MMYKRIRDLREDRDIKQQEVADFLHIKQNSYSSYETGRRMIPAEVICMLADFYNTSTDYLMGRTDEIEPYPKTKYPQE